MSGTLIDSSVLIDVAYADGPWADWSAAALTQAEDEGDICVNQIVLAETITTLRRNRERWTLIEPFIVRRDLPWRAAELAGEAHAAYRRRGGSREAILADFLIGAHAAVEGLTLLTRDPRRVRAAFPDLRLITPEA